jgi:hypothetical protein
LPLLVHLVKHELLLLIGYLLQWKKFAMHWAPKGQPQIEVTLDIDSDGILNVSAKDNNTGKEQSITIKAYSGLSDEEVETESISKVTSICG